MEIIHTELLEEATFCPKTIAFVIDKGNLTCYKLGINLNVIEDLKTNFNIDIKLEDYIDEWTEKIDTEKAIQMILKDKEKYNSHDTKKVYNRIMTVLRDNKIDSIFED
jgi:hypothetical protein